MIVAAIVLSAMSVVLFIALLIVSIVMAYGYEHIGSEEQMITVAIVLGAMSVVLFIVLLIVSIVMAYGYKPRMRSGR
jgi:preprotein translocase subunit SecG